MIKGFARKYFEGKTCIFCNKYGLYRLKDRRVKCKHCKKYYSLIKLRKDLQILYYFYKDFLFFIYLSLLLGLAFHIK